ncbi:MAG: sensor histidine kinase [Gemmatimonadota bacterium]|nr:sensor histidine kinase [Gemmatimonadota bacterium]
MKESLHCPLAVTLAERLKAEREQLVGRWLERIADRVSVDINEVFPTEDLLDHVPLLIDGIADYIANPADEITTDMPVVAKAVELGALRHKQGFDAHQILKEYEILGGILFEFLIRIVDEIPQPCSRGELLVCGHRVFRSVTVIQQFTTNHFLQLAAEQVREREERLQGFNRTVSHELKNRIGAARGASDLLQEDWLDSEPAQRKNLAAIVSTNLSAMQATFEDLIEMSRGEADGGQESRNVLLSNSAAEAKRQLRDFAEARGVTVRIAEGLPDVDVPAAVVELVLNNYIANAIKYRDEAKGEMWVCIEGELQEVEGSAEVVVRVRDNGLGVPDEMREKLFERFFRAHETVTGEEGSGLGLSIVRETLEPIRGRAWAEFPEEGSVFAFAVPYLQDREDTPVPQH